MLFFFPPEHLNKLLDDMCLRPFTAISAVWVHSHLNEDDQKALAKCLISTSMIKNSRQLSVFECLNYLHMNVNL